MRLLVIATTLMAAALPAAAEIVDIQWSGDGRFLHATRVAPGKFVELCGKLPAGQQVRWQFESGVPVDFNVHYHVGKEVMFPIKLSAVASARNTLDARIAQDYCWMWTNKSAAATPLTVTLQR